MEDTTRTLPHADAEPSAPAAAAVETAFTDLKPDAPDGPPPYILYLRKGAAGSMSLLAVLVIAGLVWIASDATLFNGFQRLVAGLGAAGVALAAGRFLRAAIDQRPKLVIDAHGVRDLRARLSLPWADLRRAWVIEGPSGPVLALEPVAGAGPFKRSLWQRLRQQDPALGFPQVPMSLKGLGFKTESLLAAIGERKPDAVLN